MNNQFNLSTPLLQFADEPEQNAFCIRNACEGLAIFGNTGGGKTSGSGAFFADRYLRAGFGLLVLTAKEDEAQTWARYCAKAGRSDDLIIVEPNGKHFFNFLEYESTVKSGLSYAGNLLNLLKVVIEAGEERATGGDRDPFWQNSLELLIKNVINLCLLGYGKVSLQKLFDISQTAPMKQEHPKEKATDEPSAFQSVMTLAKKKIKARVDAFNQALKKSSNYDCLSEDEYAQKLNEAIPEYRVLKSVNQFFSEGLYSLADKTRSIISFSLNNFLSRLLDDPIYDLFCNRPSTFTPESCIDEGKIIVINLPVGVFEKVGQDAQTMIKYIFQKAWQRRNLALNNRPVCLWADEAQEFIHPMDAALQATARSSRVCTVYLSQNLPNYHANMGGSSQKSGFKVKAFLSTLSTKIFHCNNDIDTNNYASALIGKAYTQDHSNSTQIGDNVSVGDSEHFVLEDMVRPDYFTALKNGGLLNDRVVEAYIHMQGVTFSNGFSFKKIRFHQNAY